MFKFKLKNFPRHCFTINHTEKTICQLKENLTESEVIKIQDFSENYTCLLPDEVQSMRWTQNQAAVYPVVVVPCAGHKTKLLYIQWLSFHALDTTKLLYIQWLSFHALDTKPSCCISSGCHSMRWTQNQAAVYPVVVIPCAGHKTKLLYIQWLSFHALDTKPSYCISSGCHSMRWTQNQATVYPVVVIPCAGHKTKLLYIQWLSFHVLDTKPSYCISSGCHSMRWTQNQATVYPVVVIPCTGHKTKLLYIQWLSFHALDTKPSYCISSGCHSMHWTQNQATVYPVVVIPCTGHKTKLLYIQWLSFHALDTKPSYCISSGCHSMRWTQNQATVYPVVVIRKVDGVLREDNFVIISNDRNHDVPFVELSNEMIHKYYASKGIIFSHDIEINNGCASQYKSIKGFSSMARRKIKTTRIYFESSHGKSKSNGLGGVVKAFVSRAVSTEKVVIRDAKELFDYCNENLTVIDNTNDDRNMLNRVFMYIPDEDIGLYRETFPDNNYKSLFGTRMMHQVTTKLNGIFSRNLSCVCESCISGSLGRCFYHTIYNLEENFDLVYKWNLFCTNNKGDGDIDFTNGDVDDFDDTDDFIETNASKLINNGNITVIYSGDEVSQYYLLQLNCDPFITCYRR